MGFVVLVFKTPVNVRTHKLTQGGTMRTVSYLILVVLLSQQCLLAQEDSTNRASSKALLFSFQGFNLGGGVGGKYWLNDKYALRGTVSLSYSDQAWHNDLLYSYQDNPEYRSYNVSLGAGIEDHFVLGHNISPYFGIVGNVGWVENDEKYSFRDSTTVRVVSGRSVGGSLLLGIEYRVISSISFAGEQTIGFSYTSYSGYNAYSTFTFRSTTSTLMLLIYL